MSVRTGKKKGRRSRNTERRNETVALILECSVLVQNCGKTIFAIFNPLRLSKLFRSYQLSKKKKKLNSRWWTKEKKDKANSFSSKTSFMYTLPNRTIKTKVSCKIISNNSLTCETWTTRWRHLSTQVPLLGNSRINHKEGPMD